MIDRDLPLKKEISERVKKLMKAKSWTQLKLSEESGISKSTLSDYINCKTLINPGNVEKLAATFNVSKSDIDPSFKRTDVLKEEKITYIFDDSLQLPLYGDIAAGALATVEGVTEDRVEYINIPEVLLGKHAFCDGLFVMKVNGDSMNKIIKNGSYVVAKPVDTHSFKDDDIVIFSYDREYSMKRVRRDEEDQVLIFSPESHDRKFRDIEVPYNTNSELKIYAKVVWYSTTLD